MMEFTIINKRQIFFVIMISYILVILVIFFNLIQKHYKIYQATQMYYEFINGTKSVDSWNIHQISTPTGEPERRYSTNYAMVDITGDGIPELHINNGKDYLIFFVQEGEMHQFAYFQSYLRQYHPLVNGTFLFKEVARHEYGDYYIFFELDTSGNPIHEVSFSWIDCNDNYIYDENDEYVFDGKLCTYEEWYAMTRIYLYTDTTGTEQIRNAAEWTMYCTYR